jgi:enterochelin esterase-like enzyme
MALRISRRAVLIGGGLAVTASVTASAFLVDAGVLPGQGILNEALGRCDVDVPPLPSVPLGPLLDGEFDSMRRRTRVGYRLAYPPGSVVGARLPVCLVLHGYGRTARDGIDAGRYDRYLAAAVAAGLPPFVLAACDGGPGYWHPHPADDPLGMLFEEFLPLLAGRALAAGPSDRLAVLGWSMGGYGALLCGVTQPERFVAVVASGPAIWRSYGEAHRVNAGAFESAPEWAAYDLFAHADRLRGRNVRIDCGDSDPFAPAVRALRDRLPDPGMVHMAKGCHNDAFWQHAAPTQLRLIGEALNRT